MCSIKFISNTKGKLIDTIKDVFDWAENIDIAVAYLKTSGYNLIKDKLNIKKARIIVGFDFCLTDTDPLIDILKKGHLCKIYKTPMSNDERSYHPKIYVAKKENEVRVVIGSSNLTNGGLYSNVEGNVLLCGDRSEHAVKGILEFFEEKWNSASSVALNKELISEYANMKSEYDAHIKRIHSKPSFVSKKYKISSKGISLIICLTKGHDRGDIYNRLVAVPIGAKKIAFDNIKKGTRLFIYYIGEGISKVVEALDKPYIDHTVIDEWKDGRPETYPVRVQTKLLHHFSSSIKLGKLRDLGVCRVDTDTKIVAYHLRSSLMPISDNDGDTIEQLLSQQ